MWPGPGSHLRELVPGEAEGLSRRETVSQLFKILLFPSQRKEGAWQWDCSLHREGHHGPQTLALNLGKQLLAPVVRVVTLKVESAMGRNYDQPGTLNQGKLHGGVALELTLKAEGGQKRQRPGRRSPGCPKVAPLRRALETRLRTGSWVQGQPKAAHGR